MKQTYKPKSILVGFTVTNDNLESSPPFVNGTLDSIWVYAKNDKLAIEAAKQKLKSCYGVTAYNYFVCG